MKDIPIRADPNFDELVKEIARERISKGKDKKFKSCRRITLAMVRHPLMREIERDIIDADLVK